MASLGSNHGGQSQDKPSWPVSGQTTLASLRSNHSGSSLHLKIMNKVNKASLDKDILVSLIDKDRVVSLISLMVLCDLSTQNVHLETDQLIIHLNELSLEGV